MMGEYSRGKRLLIISTGGTIGQTYDKDTYTTTNVGDKEADKFAELMEESKNSLKLESLKPIRIFDKDSSNVDPDDWKRITEAVKDNYDDYDAFVVTHGTNTLAFTCSALSFAFENIGKPVVLTGSQIPLGYPGSDAILNLQNAIRVATDTPQPIFGVTSVFGSQIITGVRVKKITEFDYDAFKSFNTYNMPIGRIGLKIRIYKDALEEHLRWYNPKARGKSELRISDDFDMRILSLTEFPGLTSNSFISMVEGMEARGVIFRAFGVGDPNIAPQDKKNEKYDLREAFAWLKDRNIPVIVTSQASDGVASMDINDPGRFASELGAIPAWDMSLETMTVKLAWLLARSASSSAKARYAEIQSQFTKVYKGEIDTSK